MKGSLLWQLLLVFAPLSVLTIGGGQSIVADMQLQTVDLHHWLTQTQFLDDFAISRAAPGPNTLIVTLIGWQVAGIGGALLTSLAIFLPSSLMFYGLSVLWQRHAFGRWRERVARGLGPISVGLVMASSYTLLITDGGGVIGWLVTAGSLLALLISKASPLLLLAAGAAVFLARTLLGL